MVHQQRRNEQEKSTDELKKQLDRSTELLDVFQERVRTIVETIPVGLFVTSAEGKIESASPICLELFRCRYEDLMSRDVRQLFVLDAQKSEQFLSPTQNQTRELVARRADGTQFPASLKVSTLAKSSVPGVLVVVEDVTAKHELERLRQEFISMMTHDLRTPLTSVKCFLNLITEGVFDDKYDLLKTKASGVEGDTGRLINMINSLLNLHKLEAGKLELIQEVVMVRTLVNRSIQSIVDFADKRGVSLQSAAIADSLLVSADEDYTIQVLVNLLSNAVKFSPDRSVVTVSVAVSDKFVKIMVSDRGRGISKEFQSRLFNRFEQAQLSDARVEGGSGIGLAIAKAIVEEQGGSIGVDSEVGQGCTFWFTLVRELPD